MQSDRESPGTHQSSFGRDHATAGFTNVLHFKTDWRVPLHWAVPAIFIGAIFFFGGIAFALLTPADERTWGFILAVMFSIGFGTLILTLGLNAVFWRDETKVDLDRRVVQKRWCLFGFRSRSFETPLDGCEAVRIRRETTSGAETKRKHYTYSVIIKCDHPDLDDGYIELAEYRTHPEARGIGEDLASKAGLSFHDPYGSRKREVQKSAASDQVRELGP